MKPCIYLLKKYSSLIKIATHVCAKLAKNNMSYKYLSSEIL